MGLFSWVGDVVETVGEFIRDPLGLGNIGESIPQSFSLEHNLNIAGKIEAKVNVTGEVKVIVETPDLVQAADLIREGLVGFDLTGGALRQLVSTYSASLHQRRALMELRRIVQVGVTDDTTATYHLHFSMVNDATELASSNDRKGYSVGKMARCSATVAINGRKLLDQAFLVIGATPAGVTLANPPRIDRELVITNVESVNVITIGVSDLGESESLKPCKIQVRVIKATPQWQYTLFESIIDGESGTTTLNARWTVNHDIHKALPRPNSEGSTLLSNSITELAAELAKPPAVTGDSLAALTRALVDATGEKVKKTEAVKQVLSSLEDESRDAFDVRTPFVAAMSNHGPAKLEVSIEVLNSVHITIIERAQLGSRDEIALQVPFEADFSDQDDPITRVIRYKVKAVGGSTFFSASLYSGHEWNKQVVYSKSGFIGESEISFEMPITLVDNLANQLVASP